MWNWIFGLWPILAIAAAFGWIGLWRLSVRSKQSRATCLAAYDLIWNFCALLGLAATATALGGKVWELERGQADRLDRQAKASMLAFDVDAIVALNCVSTSAAAQLSDGCTNARSLHAAKARWLAASATADDSCQHRPDKGLDLAPQSPVECRLADVTLGSGADHSCMLAQCRKNYALQSYRLDVYSLTNALQADATLAHYRDLLRQGVETTNADVHRSWNVTAWPLQWAMLPILAIALGLRLAKAIFDLLDRLNDQKRLSPMAAHWLHTLRLYTSPPSAQAQSD